MSTVLETRMGKGEATRERILEIAEAAVLAKGFGATSIEEVIAEAGLTKSGFFYHFKDKNALAREMLRRYVATNDRLFDDIFARGRQLSDDPLQAFLISLKLLAETMADLPSGHPGCLIASICYQERLFDREVRELTAQSVRDWNARFRGILDGIAAVYPPREPVDLDDVADMLSCIVDGAIIMSKTLNDPSRLERQILIFRSCVKLMFARADAFLTRKARSREAISAAARPSASAMTRKTSVLSIEPRTRSLPGPVAVRMTSSPECTLAFDHRRQIAEAQHDAGDVLVLVIGLEGVRLVALHGRLVRDCRAWGGRSRSGRAGWRRRWQAAG